MLLRRHLSACQSNSKTYHLMVSVDILWMIQDSVHDARFNFAALHAPLGGSFFWVCWSWTQGGGACFWVGFYFFGRGSTPMGRSSLVSRSVSHTARWVPSQVPSCICLTILFVSSRGEWGTSCYPPNLCMFKMLNINGNSRNAKKADFFSPPPSPCTPTLMPPVSGPRAELKRPRWHGGGGGNANSPEFPVALQQIHVTGQRG